MHGGVAKDDLKTENVEALKKGLVNLQRHVENVKKFGLPVAVAVNHFIKDTDNEVKALIEFCDGLLELKQVSVLIGQMVVKVQKNLQAMLLNYVRKMKINSNSYMKVKLLFLKK